MKDSLLIVLFFVIGLLASLLNWLPNAFYHSDISTWVLYILMFAVGISLGSDREALSVLRRINWKVVLVPLLVIAGSLGATAAVSYFFTDMSAQEAMAVGAGFGYYSLSSILINEMHSETLGTIGLLANVIRELITLLLAPAMVVVFGKLSPVASGGATAMDTTLPIITRVSGNQFGVLAVFSGVVLTILVPFIVTFILSF